MMKKIKINNIETKNPLVSGPMSQITHVVLRDIISNFGGVGLMFSEMLDAKILLREEIINNPWLDRGNCDVPLIYQIFVSNSDNAKNAAIKLRDMGAEGIDVNMGCAAHKIRKQDSGVMLMKDISLSKSIIESIRSVYDKALTIKIRTGFEDDVNETIRFCNAMIESGIDAVFYHPRLYNQKFKARSKWQYVSKLKKELSVPVIGNGDIQTKEDASFYLDNYDVDGIMISRSAAVKPWIFKEVECLLLNELFDVKIDKKKIWLDFASNLSKYFNEKEALDRLIKWTEYFSKNFIFNHSFWKAVNNAETFNLARNMGMEFLERNS